MINNLFDKHRKLIIEYLKDEKKENIKELAHLLNYSESEIEKALDKLKIMLSEEAEKQNINLIEYINSL